MDLLLQIWGAGFYLLNKFLFALAEKKTEQTRKKLKISGWLALITGVPAWIYILAIEGNWIATAVEAGGIPAMLLGLYNTYHNQQKHNKALDRTVLVITYFAVILGVGYSVYVHGGITMLSQLLEMGMVVGFLLGSYFMARSDSKGWLFFMLMNASTLFLMLIQDKPILMIQQILSLGLVVYGYMMVRKSHKVIYQLDKETNTMVEVE